MSPMTSSAETRNVTCPSCGAVVPPIGETHARCAFCLGWVEIPPELRVPVVRQTELQRRFVAALEAEELARRGAVSQKFIYGGIAATLFSIGLFNLIGMVIIGVESANVVGIFAGTMGVPSTIVVTVAVAWLRHRGREARSLASLPLVWFQSDTLTPCCSRCGAEVATSADEILTTCRHCGTRGLLPCTMVDARLRAKHARVVAARQRGDALQEASASLGTTINESVGYAFLIAAAAVLVGMPTYYSLNPPHAYTGGPVMDVFGEIMMAAVFTSGLLGLFGVLSIRNARKKK